MVPSLWRNDTINVNVATGAGKTMQYNWFEVRNFRGIKFARIELVPGGAGIFTLIGLNESGKTTILEAISSFRTHGDAEKSLYQTAQVDDDPASFVPKHQKFNFTGDVAVTAELEFGAGEIASCIRYAQNGSEWIIDPSSVPDKITVTRGYRFVNSDQSERLVKWSINLRGSKGRSKKIVDIPQDSALYSKFKAMASTFCPEIVYFPTFIFDQPEKIVLNPQDNERTVDRLYRSLIANVGASLPTKISIKTHIVERILGAETMVEQFVGLFGLSQNKQQQIDSVINELSHALTETVFDSWSKIFGKSFVGREVRLRLGVDKFDDDSPRIYLQIGLKDGKQQYDLSERSLGFRWFFSFLMFTLYRSTSSSGRGTIFLLDEPASNLHSSAQTLLIESFPRITSGNNILMYSTHSHYLINPEWLDQAFIISNRSMDYDDLQPSGGQNVPHTDVVAEKYRNFVGKNPDKITYFQPVIDKLQVVPSKLDAIQPSVLVEGKGDYLILSYGRFICGIDRADYVIIPTRGADSYHEIVGMMLGWGVNFCLCFDDDPAGQKVAKEYIQDWAMADSRVFTLGEIDESLNLKSIEGFLASEDLALISSHYGIDKNPSKSQIQLFFSEWLARREKLPLSAEFMDRVLKFDARVRLALELNPLPARSQDGQK